MFVYMNFALDHDELIKRCIVETGCQPDLKTHPLGRFVMLYGLQQRMVPARPYVVKKSRELLKSMHYQELEAVIDEVVRTFKTGDIKPYLSKFAESAHHKDNMLVHWGIYHLHLSPITTLQANGYVKRADHLLFFRISGDTVHLIDILGHREPDVFVETRLLEVVDKNWPDLHEAIEHMQLVGTDPKPAEQKSLNRKNVNTFLNVNGRAIMPTLGATTAGTPFLATWDHIRLIRRLKNIEDAVRNQPEKYTSGKGWATVVNLVGVDKTYAYVQAADSTTVYAFQLQ